MSKTLINFVHANGFPAGSYQALFNHFPKNYQVIFNEKYGHNPKYPVKDNWQPQVDELITFVKKELLIHNEQQVISIGHSFGGVIAFIAACQQPKLFKGLIMLDPPVLSGSAAVIAKLLKKTRFFDKFSPASKSKVRRTYWPLGTDIAKLFAPRQLFKNFDPQCLADYISHGIIERNNQLELVFSAQVETDIFRHLAVNLSSYRNQLNVPASLIYADKTDVFPHKYFKKFVKLNKNINLNITQGSHMFPLEHPKKTAQLITDTIKEW
jgi:pimeloyl-ACP methyl ester carboxylesterase